MPPRKEPEVPLTLTLPKCGAPLVQGEEIEAETIEM
jgi:hypothetical protein